MAQKLRSFDVKLRAADPSTVCGTSGPCQQTEELVRLSRFKTPGNLNIENSRLGNSFLPSSSCPGTGSLQGSLRSRLRPGSSECGLTWYLEPFSTLLGRGKAILQSPGRILPETYSRTAIAEHLTGPGKQASPERIGLPTPACSGQNTCPVAALGDTNSRDR